MCLHFPAFIKRFHISLSYYQSETLLSTRGKALSVGTMWTGIVCSSYHWNIYIYRHQTCNTDLQPLKNVNTKQSMPFVNTWKSAPANCTLHVYSYGQLPKQLLIALDHIGPTSATQCTSSAHCDLMWICFRSHLCSGVKNATDFMLRL